MGAILPPDNDTQALKEDKSWRLIFAIQPILLIITIILFCVMVKHDPPRFYIQQG